MVVTVQGASPVPVCWLVDRSPESLWASWEAWMSVSDLDFTYWDATAQLAEVWLLDVSSMLDLPQVFRTEMKLAHVMVVHKLVCSGTSSGRTVPASSPARPLFYCFPICNKKTCMTNNLVFPKLWLEVTVFFASNDRFPPLDVLWSSAAPGRDTPPLALCTGLNQSGSGWTRLRLSQMLICAAQLRAQRHSAQRHSACMWCKITWAGTPSPLLLGFCARGPGVDVTRRRGQRVPLRLRHEAEPLTAVGSRCSEVTGRGLQGRRHSPLQGLQEDIL